MTKEIKLCPIDELKDKTPAAFQINGLDLVAVRYGDNVSVLFGRCLHRGALMANGQIEGNNLISALIIKPAKVVAKIRSPRVVKEEV